VALRTLVCLVFHEGVATRDAAKVLVRERGVVKLDCLMSGVHPETLPATFFGDGCRPRKGVSYFFVGELRELNHIPKAA